MKRLLVLGLVCLAPIGAAIADKSAGEHVDDATITARVKMALLEQSAGDAMDINIETSKGVVQLAGFVDSKEVKSKAREIAADVDGVDSVSNRLRVYSGKRSAGRALDDSILAATVKLALAESDATNSFSINVEVREADVELSGFVDSYEERDAAVNIVSSINEVGEVINSIDISR